MFKDEYQPGELVLVGNTQVEKELDHKAKPCYNGPYEVVQSTKGGLYILKEIDGSVSQRGIAEFFLLPYFPCHSMPLLDKLDDHDKDLDEPEDEPDYEHDDSDDKDND
ncbi:hypothetical protein SERLADRAFT_442230 [Serpula lacrymans var. lacrymans S7.9]|uniref:Uncharacterized protein n=1 Tax=Serpula lacrymans var. lacrymans (strain S7.9) TaxID=578457 RepID=F8P8U5_SERL9|nr:uncharacterized protein SERLADRAFT_442230 [Serpula lacrymans var. lacrymans S7.9]EGO20851.1 hypothetical protein SERLADRAFT_442230 [Serpula lacrymans var. lacrymans S7.9]